MSFSRRWTSGEFSACVLMALCASSAPMIALSSSVFRSGDVANTSFT
jgi:hypothetical protein